jgi:hypothetical protein
VFKLYRQVCKEHGHFGPQEEKEEIKPGSAYGNGEQEFLEKNGLFQGHCRQEV